MRSGDYAWFTFKPLTAEITLSSSIKTVSSNIKFTLDAYGQNILFINREYAVCSANYWRLSKTQNRVQPITLTISQTNELADSENSEFVKYWKLENCVGRMTVYENGSENNAGCDLNVWIPSRNLRVLRQQLLNGKLPYFFSVNFRTALTIGQLEHGIDPGGSDWFLNFEHENAIQVPIYFTSFGYKACAETTEHTE